MAQYTVKEGTRITVDSAFLNEILNESSCANMKRKLCAEICKQTVEAKKSKDKYLAVAYVCDGRACDFCDGTCTHTSDIRHAQNFCLNGGHFEEKEYKANANH